MEASEKQEVKDEKGDTLEKFTCKLNTWKLQRRQFFEDLNNTKKLQAMFKSFQTSSSSRGLKLSSSKLSVKSKSTAIVEMLGTLSELVKYMASQVFGVLVADIIVEEVVFPNSFHGFECICWIQEMLQLESRGFLEPKKQTIHFKVFSLFVL